jgi:hypothetical protein
MALAASWETAAPEELDSDSAELDWQPLAGPLEAPPDWMPEGMEPEGESEPPAMASRARENPRPVEGVGAEISEPPFLPLPVDGSTPPSRGS